MYYLILSCMVLFYNISSHILNLRVGRGARVKGSDGDRVTHDSDGDEHGSHDSSVIRQGSPRFCSDGYKFDSTCTILM